MFCMSTGEKAMFRAVEIGGKESMEPYHCKCLRG